MSGDWAGRAGTVEDVIRRRFVRRLGERARDPAWAGALAPAAADPPWPWHYWWQAHLLGLPCSTPTAARHSRCGRSEIGRADPNSAAAQLRLLDQRLLRRHRLVRPGRTARRATGPAAPRPPRPPAARRHRPPPGGLDSRRRRRRSGGAAGTTSKRPRQRSGRNPGRPRRDLEFTTKITDSDRGHPDRPADRPGPRRGPASTRTGRSAPWKPRLHPRWAERDGHPRWAERAATGPTAE